VTTRTNAAPTGTSNIPDIHFIILKLHPYGHVTEMLAVTEPQLSGSDQLFTDIDTTVFQHTEIILRNAQVGWSCFSAQFSGLAKVYPVC